jgi:hypothetical protein
VKFQYDAEKPETIVEGLRRLGLNGHSGEDSDRVSGGQQAVGINSDLPLTLESQIPNELAISA